MQQEDEAGVHQGRSSRNLSAPTCFGVPVSVLCSYPNTKELYVPYLKGLNIGIANVDIGMCNFKSNCILHSFCAVNIDSIIFALGGLTIFIRF